MPAFVIVDIEITDPEQYERYKALGSPMNRRVPWGQMLAKIRY